MKRSAIIAGLGAVLIPSVAFAAHVSSCCGDAWCCMHHLLGCCM